MVGETYGFYPVYGTVNPMVGEDDFVYDGYPAAFPAGAVEIGVGTLELDCPLVAGGVLRRPYTLFRYPQGFSLRFLHVGRPVPVQIRRWEVDHWREIDERIEEEARHAAERWLAGLYGGAGEPGPGGGGGDVPEASGGNLGERVLAADSVGVDDDGRDGAAGPGAGGEGRRSGGVS